jgi:hypothetical protein
VRVRLISSLEGAGADEVSASVMVVSQSVAVEVDESLYASMG